MNLVNYFFWEKFTKFMDDTVPRPRSRRRDCGYLGKNDSSRICSSEYGHVGGKSLTGMPISTAATLLAPP